MQSMAVLAGLASAPQASANASALVDYYFKTRSEGFGSEVKRRIMLGTYALSAGYYDAYYRQAQKVRALLKRDFDEAFQKVDVILSPVSPSPAFKIGAHENDPVAMYLEDVFTVTQAMAGIPALSVPCGFSNNNLPIGFQIMGPQWGEEIVLRAGHAYEQATACSRKNPTFSKKLRSSTAYAGGFLLSALRRRTRNPAKHLPWLLRIHPRSYDQGFLRSGVNFRYSSRLFSI